MNKHITPPIGCTLKNLKRFDSLDGIRAFAAIGIVLMHIQTNIPIKPECGILTRSIIPFFSDFTLLFMLVSGLSMCCGYYEPFKQGSISPNKFYKRRYARILPFFGFLCIIDLIVSPSWKSFYETYANFTLCFNFLPTMDIKVIGVGWFLGIVFLFYLLFPFFVFLIDNKKRAWISNAIVIGLVLIATNLYANEITDGSYIVPNRKNIVFCAPFFLMGGIIYLYRNEITNYLHNRFYLSTLLVCIITIAYFTINKPSGILNYLLEIILFASWTIYAVGTKSKLLVNRMVRFLSKISMEIYLSHMLMYRIVEKLHLENHILNSNILYLTECVLVLIGVICFAYFVKYHVTDKIGAWIEK